MEKRLTVKNDFFIQCAMTLRNITFSAIFFFLSLIAVFPVTAQDLVATKQLDPKTAEEMEYANHLMSWGMPDYAKMVLDRIRDPAALTIKKVLELQSLIALGNWEEVNARISAEPDPNSNDTWAMKLALADGLYAWGKYAEAQKIYESFFARYPSGPPEDIKDFFLNSAYKYAQMLILIGKKQEAVAAFEKLLLAKPVRDIERQVKSDMAELLVAVLDEGKVADKASIKAKIQKLTGELLWIQDLWFAKAIVYRAHVLMIDGDVDGALKIMDDYRDRLAEMDKVLKEQEDQTGQPLTKLSPMAQAHYLFGKMQQAEAERRLAAGSPKEEIATLLAGKVIGADPSGRQRRSEGAFQHFMTVFVSYPYTSWAPDAGTRAKQVQKILEDLGAVINVQVKPSQWAEVEKAQFTEARTLFYQNQFPQASETYLSVLNLFPESETAVSALGELTRCYVELKDEMMMDVVLSYLAERFGKNSHYFIKAGDELLKMSGYLLEIGLTNKSDMVVDLFFTHVPKHPRVPAMIMKKGDEKYLAKDFEGALADYTRIEEDYVDTTFYADALNRKSISLHELGQPVESIKVLTKYADLVKEKITPDAATQYLVATYRLGNAYRQLEPPKYIPNALKYYDEIIKAMTDESHSKYKFVSSSEENKKLLEGAIFNQGLCYTRLDQPEQNIAAYRNHAIKIYTDLLKRFPKSDFGPSALMQQGTLWTALGNADEAAKALQRLKQEYPQSKEAENADFALAINLLGMGRRADATKVFKDMFASGGKYSDTQILAAANALLDAKEYEIALEAFDRIKGSQQRTVDEPTLIGLGKAYHALGKVNETVTSLEALMTKYPQTGYTVDALGILSQAYRDLAIENADEDSRLDQFNKAVEYIKRMRRLDKTVAAQRESELATARIFKAKALAEEKFGKPDKVQKYKGDAAAAFQAITLFSDHKDASLKSVIEEAYNECMPLLFDMEKWVNIENSCAMYVEAYPNGKYINEMRSWRNKARVQLAVQGGVPGGAEDNLVEDVELPADDDAEQEKVLEEEKKADAPAEAGE